MDHLGSRVSPVSPDARKWSLLGAVLKETEGGEFERVLEVLKVPCDTVYIDTWNNTDGRTQADVLCMLNNVILEEMAKESGSLSHEPSKNL